MRSHILVTIAGQNASGRTPLHPSSAAFKEELSSTATSWSKQEENLGPTLHSESQATHGDFAFLNLLL